MFTPLSIPWLPMFRRSKEPAWQGSRRPDINSLRPRQDGRHFPDDIFKSISLNGNVLISIKISLKFVPKGLINNIPALVQVMAWRRPGDKPLSEPMMVSLLTWRIYASLGLNELTLINWFSTPAGWRFEYRYCTYIALILVIIVPEWWQNVIEYTCV